jgi:transposase InsO family protein
VRDLHGVIGADALRSAVDGVSRRQAMAIKRATLTAMERERRARCERVHITTPSVVRGMDAMYQMTSDGFRWLLIFGDASVPYRTSAPVIDAYDSAAVARAIASDFEKNGAPLVLRMDRASCHRTDEVARVLAAHGVLALHGPPHHPGFYGQLERQNRDHRAWLRVLGVAHPGTLSAHVERMRVALNERWPRRMLGFQTAAERWSKRPIIDADRKALAQEVQHHASHYRRGNVSDDVAQRLAIEKALTKQGWLRREVGGWC